MNPSTRLTGRSLRLARTLWLLLALTYAGLVLAGLPARLAAAPDLKPDPSWSDAQVRAAFVDLGLPLEGLGQLIRWSNVLLPIAYLVLGLFLAWRRSDDWVALLLSLTFISFLATGSFTAVFGAGPTTAWLDNVSNALVTSMGFVILFVFPDGRFVPGWTRWVVLAEVAIQAWRVFYPAQYEAVGFVFALPIFLTLPLAQLYRYFRAADSVQRQQIKWVAFALALTVTPLAFFALQLGLNPAARQPGAPALALFLFGSLSWNAVIIFWPLSITLAVLRYGLFDIDVIIRRTLVYAVLTSLLALAYFGSVVVLQNTFGALTGQSQSALVTVLSTLGIAALFAPLRRRVQAFIDRRFYRRKYDAARTLAAFGASVRDEVELDRLSEHLIQAVREAMAPESVNLWLRK